MQNKLKKLVVFMLIGCFILSCIPCTAASKEQEVINGSLTEEVPAEAETGATEGNVTKLRLMKRLLYYKK